MTSFKLFTGSALFVMAAAVGAGASVRTVEYPWINFADNSTLDIAKVEMTDSNTVVTFDAYYIPKYWIRIDGKAHLKAAGKDYALIGSEGITPDTRFWMPESGRTAFKLIFEPLPPTTEEFDFIEGEAPNLYKLCGVELTAREYLSRFPAEVTGEIKDGGVPAPVLGMGKTTVNFHLRPFSASIPPSLAVYVNNISGAQNEYTVKIDAEGNGSLSFDQYGTVRAVVVPEPGRKSTNIRLQPGETVDCYIDMRMTGTQAMKHRKGFSRVNLDQVAHTGVFNDLDRLMDRNATKYRMNLYSGDFADYRMTGEEYKRMVKARYDALSDSIARSDKPRMWKEYSQLELQNNVLEAMAKYQFLLAHNYRSVYDQWNPDHMIPEDSIRAILTPEDYAEVSTWFDMSNPGLLLGGSEIGDMNWGEYGVKGDLSRSIELYSEMAEKAAETKLEQADIELLKTLSNPFFAAACDSINQRAIRECQRLQAVSAVTPTPDVPAEQILETIIAPHKGKVVVVDLWNTWCGPCRAALKHHEPLKNGALSDEDIVWIYLADESSDPVKYLQLLPEIKGIHYKLSKEQIGAIGSRFKVDGIPYYILVDREGNAEGRPDMRADNTFINAIKSKL